MEGKIRDLCMQMEGCMQKERSMYADGRMEGKRRDRSGRLEGKIEWKERSTGWEVMSYGSLEPALSS